MPNHAIAPANEPVTPRLGLQDKVEDAFQAVLEALQIDTENDPNTKETAKRVAKMFCKEIFRGRFEPCPSVTLFEPRDGQTFEPYYVGPIPVRSTCSHHFCPIVGKAWVLVIPGEKLMGLSKFSRLIDWVASRPQIQEEMTEQIADILSEKSGADGIVVQIIADHSCMTLRGVKDACGGMVTRAKRGIIFPQQVVEFLDYANRNR